MNNRSSSPAPLRPNQRANAATIAVLCGSLVGALAGWWLPWATWQSGGWTPLGDFAILLVLGFGAMRLVRSAWTPARITFVLGAVGGTLLVRELAWRHHPPALAIIYGVAVWILIARLVGVLGYQLYRELSKGAAWRQLPEADMMAGLALGLLLLIWFVAAVVGGV